MLEHGGRLRAAAQTFGIPLESWVDLSTGISPWCYPVPTIPETAWHRLPEPEDALDAAAARYYGNAALLATSGSQAAIQMLPRLFAPGPVTLIGPTYNEHAAAWRTAGHTVTFVADLSEALTRGAPVTLLCNPNNPTATQVDRATLLHAASHLQRRGGWLIVDEAYGDATPAFSVTPDAGMSAAPRLITLRSLGKFFGLAGARVGFLFGDAALRYRLNDALGPWTINGPARWVAQHALNDIAWQTRQRERILESGARLHTLLHQTLPTTRIASTGLFSTCMLTPSTDARRLFEHLARCGILTRLFVDDGLVRIGIPDDSAWPRLNDALKSWQHETHTENHDNR